MAKTEEGKLREDARSRYDSILHFHTFERTRVEKAIKSARYSKFREIGKKWYMLNGKLEDVLDNPLIINTLGKNIKFETKNDIVAFTTGYNEKYYFNLGHQYGCDGVLLKNIPKEFVKTDSLDNIELQKVNYFKEGYKNGLMTYCYYLGANGVRIENIPQQFTLDKELNDKYQDGLRLYYKNEDIVNRNYKTR